jgi:hypothetical protein
MGNTSKKIDFEWSMEGPVATRPLKNKSALAPHGTKALASAIPPKLAFENARSLMRTIIRIPAL